MIEVINVAEIVESNGKTIRQNNLKKKHNIPLDTLVETYSEEKDFEYEWEGMRLWVIEHTRDCDGTPLYSLGKKGQRRVVQDKIVHIGGNEYLFPFSWIENANIQTGFGEDNLRIIKLPENKG